MVDALDADHLLDQVGGSRYALVLIAAKRARQINNYHHQLGEGIGKMLRGFRKEMKQLDADKREEELRRGEIDVTPKADEKPKYTGPG